MQSIAPGPMVAASPLPIGGGVVPRVGDSGSQKSAETSDAEDEDVPAPKTPASVLCQSAQENVQVEPSDEADLQQFGENMDVEDTPLDDLQTLGDRCHKLTYPGRPHWLRV